MRKMMPIKLFIKETKSSIWSLAIFSGMVILWQLFLLSKASLYGNDQVLALSVIPIYLTLPWVLGSMLFNLYSEWNANSIYLLLSLPLRGWQIIGSKIVASLFDFVFLCIISFVSTSLFFGKGLFGKIASIAEGVPQYWIIILAVKMFLLYLIIAAVLLILGQFSFITSRMVSRFRGLVMASAAFAGLWLLIRLGAAISPLFEWVPDMVFKSWYTMYGVTHMNEQYMNSAPIIAVLFLSIGIFVFSSWIFEHYVEV